MKQSKSRNKILNNSLNIPNYESMHTLEKVIINKKESNSDSSAPFSTFNWLYVYDRLEHIKKQISNNNNNYSLKSFLNLPIFNLLQPMTYYEICWIEDTNTFYLCFADSYLCFFNSTFILLSDMIKKHKTFKTQQMFNNYAKTRFILPIAKMPNSSTNFLLGYIKKHNYTQSILLFNYQEIQDNNLLYMTIEDLQAKILFYLEPESNIRIDEFIKLNQ